MGNKHPLLSICIPTNGVVDWVVPVINSIYEQKVDNSLFEVVVSDNGENNNLEEAVKNFNYKNFYYYRSCSKGFENQIDAFEHCNGLFCKMLNHRSKLLPGSIESLLSIVEKYKNTKPIIYCAEGHAKGGEFIECANIDEFVSALGVWSSWSAGTGVWLEDIKNIRKKRIDNLFSHMVFLFELREKSDYVIWNGTYVQEASDRGKGGYDVFYAFCVRFLDLLTDLRQKGRIKIKTFIAVKKELISFVSGIYCNEVVFSPQHTFIIRNIQESISVYFGNYYYYKIILMAWLKTPLLFCKRFVRRFRQ